MKQLMLTALVLALASCADSYVPQPKTQETEPADSVQDAGGIYFDLGDTAMTEEIEEIYFSPQEWEEEDSEVDL